MITFIEQRKHLSEYHIMLYITDGAITDMKETVSSIVKASSLPLSIIIIGVGNADFQLMEDLDSDDALLTDQYGNVAKQDIVQFVEFNKYSSDVTLLHEDVLREVPDQVVRYMMMNGIKPSPVQHDIARPASY